MGWEKLEIQGGSCSLSSTTSSLRRQCDGWGGGGGMVGYKVTTLGVMLLAMVLMLARVAKPGQY